MAEDLQIIQGSKAEAYQSIIPQIKGLLDGEPDLVANLANVAAALKEQFNWLWVGFYLVKPQVTNNSQISGKLDSETQVQPFESSQFIEAFSSGLTRKEPVATELVLGPFQGPVACTRIRKGRGVCGTAWAEGKTLIVPDVEAFPGHIACSSLSQSEIVVPIIRNGEVVAVLDADSAELNSYDETDQQYLEEIVELIHM